MHRDWGIPDWHDGAAYKSSEFFSVEALRWEFLRRHPVYRAAWKVHLEGPRAKCFNFDWQREFGLIAPWEPANRAVPKFMQKQILFVPYGVDDDPEETKRAFDFVVAAGRSGHILAVMDPCLSKEENIRGIEEAYKSLLCEWGETRKPTRLNSGPVPRYLRVLDARDPDAKTRARHSDIADQFSDEGDGDDAPTDGAIIQMQSRARDLAEKLTGIPWPRDDY